MNKSRIKGMRRAGPTGALCKQRGAGLIEVLVALLLLSVALLGLARLQLETMQDQRLSYSHTLAQVLATNLAERIHANPKGIGSYAVTDIATRSPSGGCSENCTPTQLAAQDLDDWQEAIDSSKLTGASADVAVSGSRVAVTVQWWDTVTDGETEEQFLFEVLTG
ncbi:MAG TPA: type IV pilus modification protein PilV [Halomonas sp.]|nr:type IV pilus modification protein PilV [Halomonas sp.]